MIAIIDDLKRRYPVLDGIIPEITASIEAVIDSYRRGGTLFIGGNGGSAADAEHICGELLKGFKSLRPLSAEEKTSLAAAGDDGAVAEQLQGGLRAISLLSHPALTSAFGNDVAADLAFAQQIWALGRSGDVMLGISTGGSASNIRKAFIAARARGMKNILLTGNKNGSCVKYADLVIPVPDSETYRIQELHLPIYHTLCLAVEREFFGK